MNYSFAQDELLKKLYAMMDQQSAKNIKTDKLKFAEPKLWLKNYNELVLSFFESATSTNLNHENEKKNALTHTNILFKKSKYYNIVPV